MAYTSSFRQMKIHILPAKNISIFFVRSFHGEASFVGEKGEGNSSCFSLGAPTSSCRSSPVLPPVHMSFLTLVASELFLFSLPTAYIPFSKSDSIERQISQLGWFEDPHNHKPGKENVRYFNSSRYKTWRTKQTAGFLIAHRLMDPARKEHAEG